MEAGLYLNPYRSKKTGVKNVKGERIIYESTHNPSTAKPGDTLTVIVPRPSNLLIVPGTFALLFDLEITSDDPTGTINTYVVNNLAANIFSRIKIKVGSTEIYDLDHAHLYNSYKDLWLTEKQRINLIESGIQDEELRKMRSKITVSLENAKDCNVILKNIYGKRYIVPLNFELINDHMPLPTKNIEEDIIFELTINQKENILVSGDIQKADFELKNISIRYETLNNEILYSNINQSLYAGFLFLFDHIQHYKKIEIKKSDTLLNEQINVDRQSLKGILIIFQEEFTPGKRDSESFSNPDIKDIKITIGTPNRLYDSGYKIQNQWTEISKHFVPEELKNGKDIYMDMLKYYTDKKYALWIDLRCTEDNNLHNVGKIQEAKQAIALEINKKNNGTGKYIMHIFIVADAGILIQNNKFGILNK